MKREHRETGTTTGRDQGCSSNKKMWEEENNQGGGGGDGGMDELLAVLGYKVKSSDMADVALKLEQLEMAMGTFQEDGISHLSCDTVHYNPSDISAWLENMLSELNPSQSFDPNTSFPSIQNKPPEPLQKSSIIYEDNSEYDLRAIPRIAAYKSTDSTSTAAGGSGGGTITNANKRVKLETPPISTSSVNSTPTVGSIPEVTRPLVLVDSQETGVRLVHNLDGLR
ncbi:hypothetical protein Ancab_018320 [Ancistrocladus abbreviatus]